MGCTGGNPPYSYSLNGGQAQSGNQFVVSPTATTTYQITATDAAQGNTTKPVTVTFSTGGGGGGGGSISCSGFSNTQTATLNWTSGAAAVFSGVSETDAIVVVFTAGNTNKLSTLRGFDFGTTGAVRRAVLSTQPCDFGGTALRYSVNGPASTAVQQVMNVAPVAGGYPIAPLVNGTKYYWNIQFAAGSCGVNCGTKVTITP